MKMELIVRKKIASLIERVLRGYEIDFSHDRYKQIIYGEIEADTKLENKMKRYYDGYMYLLKNNKTAFTKGLLKRFLMIMLDEKIDEYILLKIVNEYNQLRWDEAREMAIKVHNYVYEELKDINEMERILIALMLFNSSLVRRNHPIITFTLRNIIKYINLMKEKADVSELIKDAINSSRYQEKSYYKNLRPITLMDIYYKMNDMKKEIEEKYKIKSILIYGSFSKGLERKDSDIDFLVMLDENISYKEKLKLIEELKDELTKEFKRYVDIHEINKYLNDFMINETKNAIKIF